MNVPSLVSSQLLLALAASGLAACDLGGLDQPGAAADLGVATPDFRFDEPDLSLLPPNACGDQDPTCSGQQLGPPWPLPGDPMPSPSAGAVNLARDGNGWLVLGAAMPALDAVWIANTSDGAGTVSRLDRGSVREVARYPTVTCFSTKGGSLAPCTGATGCCSGDDWQRYQARKAKMNQPGHQAVQRSGNFPSRTTVDWNGDLLVANQAFGGPSSVTRIAGDKSRCLDHNRDGVLQTSADSNADGWIDTDCNGNGQSDNLLDVKGLPCTNGLPQEFYGDDDECVLWTSNTFPEDAIGRPLARAATPTAVADVWAGSYNSGSFVGLDGTTGVAQADGQLPPECLEGTGPYNAVVDASGILWADDLDAGKLCYLDTSNPSRVGSVRDPEWGKAQGHGLAVDRDQNLWLGAGLERYAPDRSNGFANLGNGWWTQVLSQYTGTGIAADSRSAGAYFVYACVHNLVLQIPASTLKPVRMDQILLNPGWPTIDMPCYGVGVDGSQDVWGVSTSLTTRARVDAKGAITQPDTRSPPKGGDRCPGGDSCPNVGAGGSGDLTGFGPQHFGGGGAVRGQYTYLVRSHCLAVAGAKGTLWRSLAWEAEIPPGASLVFNVREGDTPLPDASWSAPAGRFTLTPDDLAPALPEPWGYLQILADFSAPSLAKTPRLKSMTVYAECVQ